jgi:glutamyl-tRNA reductase
MIIVSKKAHDYGISIPLDVAPTVCALQAAIDIVVRTQLKRYRTKLRALTPDQQQAVLLLLREIANKIIHPAILSLNQASQRGDVETIARICRIFGVAHLPLMQFRKDEPKSLGVDQPELMTA